jgi:membrane protein
MVEPRPDANEDAPTLADFLREASNQPVGDSRLGRWRLRGLAYAERHTSHGPLAGIAEVAWGASRRLRSVGGPALAALIAYRLFVWLLPLALVTVFLVGLWQTEPVDYERAVDRFGVSGYVTASISQATADAGGPGLVSGLVIGGLVLLYMTYALLRALRAVHALIWHLPLTRVPSPLKASLLTLALLVAIVVGRGALDGLRDAFGPLLGLPMLIGSYLLVPALWIVVSLRLPHRGSTWTDLLPGALLLSVASGLIHALVVLVLFPYLEQKQDTYGALGLAAGIMLALYALGWSIAAAAALNAELADRRQPVGTAVDSRP